MPSCRGLLSIDGKFSPASGDEVVSAPFSVIPCADECTEYDKDSYKRELGSLIEGSAQGIGLALSFASLWAVAKATCVAAQRAVWIPSPDGGQCSARVRDGLFDGRSCWINPDSRGSAAATNNSGSAEICARGAA